jgi:hypothetical protein
MFQNKMKFLKVNARINKWAHVTSPARSVTDAAAAVAGIEPKRGGTIVAKRDPYSFNFGANARPKKPRKSKKGGQKRNSSGNRGNAWRAYVGVSNAPIPD